MTNEVSTKRVYELGRGKLVAEKIESGLTNTIHKVAMNKIATGEVKKTQFATTARNFGFQVMWILGSLGVVLRALNSFDTESMRANYIKADHLANQAPDEKKAAADQAKVVVHSMLTAIKTNHLALNGGNGAAQVVAQNLHDKAAAAFSEKLLEATGNNTDALAQVLQDLREDVKEKTEFDTFKTVGVRNAAAIELNAFMLDTFSVQILKTSVDTEVAQAMAGKTELPTRDAVEAIVQNLAEKLGVPKGTDLEALIDSAMLSAEAGFKAGVTGDTSKADELRGAEGASALRTFRAGRAAAQAKMEALKGLVLERTEALDSTSISESVVAHVAAIEADVKAKTGEYKAAIKELQHALHERYIFIRENLKDASGITPALTKFTDPKEIAHTLEEDPNREHFAQMFKGYPQERIEAMLDLYNGRMKRMGENPVTKAFEKVQAARVALESVETEKKAIDTLIASTSHAKAVKAMKLHTDILAQAEAISTVHGEVSVTDVLKTVDGLLNVRYNDEDGPAAVEMKKALIQDAQRSVSVTAQKLILDHVAMDKVVTLDALSKKCPEQVNHPVTGNMVALPEVAGAAIFTFDTKRMIPEYVGYSERSKAFRDEALKLLGTPVKGDAAHPMNVLFELIYDEASTDLGAGNYPNPRVFEGYTGDAHGEHIFFNDTKRTYIREALKKLDAKMHEVSDAAESFEDVSF